MDTKTRTRTSHPSNQRFPGRPDKPLNRREQRFVEEYIGHMNGRRAAIAAGYSEKTATVQASQLLTRLNVQTALEQAQQARAERVGWTPDDVLRNLRPLTESDISDYFTPEGRLKPFHALTADQRRAIASVKVTQRKVAGTEAEYEEVLHLKLHDKNRALELAMKHFGILSGEGAQPPREVPVFALPADGPQIVNVH